jgi:hypothetical protein
MCVDTRMWVVTMRCRSRWPSEMVRGREMYRVAASLAAAQHRVRTSASLFLYLFFRNVYGAGPTMLKDLVVTRSTTLLWLSASFPNLSSSLPDVIDQRTTPHIATHASHPTAPIKWSTPTTMTELQPLPCSLYSSSYPRYYHTSSL